jgi:hypothetical protein
MNLKATPRVESTALTTDSIAGWQLFRALDLIRNHNIHDWQVENVRAVMAHTKKNRC